MRIVNPHLRLFKHKIAFKQQVQVARARAKGRLHAAAAPAGYTYRRVYRSTFTDWVGCTELLYATRKGLQSYFYIIDSLSRSVIESTRN